MKNRRVIPTNQPFLNAVLSVFAVWLVTVPISLLAQSAFAQTASPLNKLVAQTLESTVRIENAQNRSSGAIVSRKGHILTVAHGLNPNASGIRVFHSGQHYAAVLLKHDINRDLALLQLVDAPAEIPALELASVQTTRSLRKDDLLLATGCPARESNAAGPVVRMGTVKAIASKYVRSSCVLTAGDSGGPVVGADGSLVGVNARIGAGRNSNLHIPVSTVRSFVAGIEEFKPIRSTNSSEVTFPRHSATAVRELSKLQAVVLGKDGRRICFGCQIDESTIVTKLSLLDVIPVPLRLGTIDVEAELISSNRKLDLAVLKIPRKTDFRKPRTSEVNVGDLVYSGDGLRGVSGRNLYSEPNSKPVLGCTLEVDGQRGMLVDLVTENSAAADAKLQPGDRLTSFCGHLCQKLDDIGNTIADLQPGDIVTFVTTTQNVQRESHGRLRHRPEALLDRTEYLDGQSGALSNRRTGFGMVIQHDSGIDPTQVGGPLVDSAGRLVGINIARRSRESVLAIPITTVLKLTTKQRAIN